MISTKLLEKWRDIICYWEDVVQEYAERFDSEYSMYEKYDKMIEEMCIEERKLKNKIGNYKLTKKLKITKGK